MQRNDRKGSLAGRATIVNPPNRFEITRHEVDGDQLDSEPSDCGQRVITSQYLPDQSNSIICQNESPDIPFRYSINPYRGCEHGCAYCYARPGHEMLGMSAGLDFETKILVKYDATTLLRRELNKPSWRAELLTLSGVTDCYQPAERKFCLTRGVLEVILETRQPLGIITKNVLLLRDSDLLVPMAQGNRIHVFLSITTLNQQLSRKLEPRTSSPMAKLRAIRTLSEAGVPVGVMVAPVIPGLTDYEIPAILAQASEAGARTAGFILLRLPWSVAPIFLEWLNTNYPTARSRVESLIRETREGRLNTSQFGQRHIGQGVYADGIRQTFHVFAKQFGLDRGMPPLDRTQFRPPRVLGEQLHLF